MSTIVDDPQEPTRAAAPHTRERIKAAAAAAFSAAGYDAVGVRAIAAAAGVDPAMVSRLFGSKAALFADIADGAFGLEDFVEGPVEALGAEMARALHGPMPAARPDGFDDFTFLLRSVGSPTGAPILAAAIERDFIAPLAARLQAPDARARAALVTAYILGYAVLRAGLNSPGLADDPDGALQRLLSQAIQAALDG